MSDSEDTDSLMSVATPAGLQSFLGLTVDQMSKHINSLTNSSNTENNEVNRNSIEEPKGGAPASSQPRESILDQLAEWSDSDNDGNNDEHGKYDSDSEVSTASTNSITMLMASDAANNKEELLLEESYEDEHIEVIDTSAASGNFDQSDDNNAFDLRNGIPETSANNILEFKYDMYKGPNYGVRISPGFGSQGVDFLRPSPNSGWRYLPGSEHAPQLIQRAPNFRTPGGYRPPENPVPPRDLTDAQIHDEVRRMYAFPEQEEVENENEPNSVNKEERSKGNESQKGTPEVIAKATPGLKGEGDSGIKEEVESQIIPNPSTAAHSANDPRDKLDARQEESAGAAGESSQVKRKLFAAGDTPGSIPDLGFGLRDFDKLEVKEKPLVPSNAWTTTTAAAATTTTAGSSNSQSGSSINESSGQEKVKNVRRRDKAKASVSFAQFHDDSNMEISPIKAAYLEKNGLSTDISRCLPRYRPSGSSKKNNSSSSSTNNSPAVKSPTKKKVNLLELDLLWRDIHSTKERMEEDIQKSAARLQALSIIDPLRSSQEKSSPQQLSQSFVHEEPPAEGRATEKLETYPSTSKKTTETPSPKELSKKSKKKVSKSILKLKEAARQQQDSSKGTDVSFDFSGATDDLPSTMSGLDSSLLPTDLDTLELSSILSAAHLKASEFEEILDKLDDFDDDTFEEINDADEEIETVLTKLEVSDWAKSGANEYLQKFHEEKFKREHCEKEIASLQKAVLKLQEESAVRDKMVNKKDAVLIKMSKAWSEVTTQWKAHEVHSKEVLDKLQVNQRVLSESLRLSRDRIEAYEKELATAVELAASFKTRLEELENVRQEEVEKLESNNVALSGKFQQLESSLGTLKVEKDTAVRALSESQKQLDERFQVHQEMQEKLSFLELESEERQKDLEKVSGQKKVLEEHLQSVAVQKDNLEGQLVDLTQQLRLETEEKERLKLSQDLEIERQLKEESDRLHNYYNAKLQEAIQNHTTKMSAAESLMVGEHQRQLTQLEKDMMRKIRDCKNRCMNEANKMKNRYEGELKLLRDDIAQKQMFISTISHQLQSYVKSDSRSQEVERSGHVIVPPSNINLSSSHHHHQHRKDQSDFSLASSTDSTVESSPKYRVHVRTKKPEERQQQQQHPQQELPTDEGNSSVEDFQPSKLCRYNTSTPNSILESSPTMMKSIKGWRELPNIRHLLHPEGEHLQTTPRSSSPRVSLSEASKILNLFPATRLLNDSYLESPTKLRSAGAAVVAAESSLDNKCIHTTLAKFYSEQLYHPSESTTQPGFSSGGRDHDLVTQYTATTHTATSASAPSSKTTKDNTNFLINAHRPGNPVSELPPANRRGSSATTTITIEPLSHTKQAKLLKPPWK